MLFAFQGDEVRARMLDVLDDKDVGYKRKSFMERADQVRAVGYANFPSEAVDGVIDLSVPILHYEHAVGALAIPFIDRRPPVVGMKHALACLRKPVADISASLAA